MTSATAPQSAAACRRGLQDSASHVRMGVLAKLLDETPWAANLAQDVSGLMGDPSDAVRELAVVVLSRAGQAGVPGLIRGLHPQQKSKVRAMAANGLANVGPDAREAVKPLCGSVILGDDDLRWQASFALGKIGEPAVESVVALLTSTDDPKVRTAAIEALGWIGPPAEQAAEQLQAFVQDQESPTPMRMAACSAMIRITEASPGSLPFLVEQLGHDDPEVRQEALDRIGELRESGRDAQDDILRAIDDPAAPVRSAAALALVKINASPDDGVRVVMPLLDDSEPEVRASAGMALHAFGPAAKIALTKLKTMTRDNNPRVAAITKAAVAKIEGREVNHA